MAPVIHRKPRTLLKAPAATDKSQQQDTQNFSEG